MSFLVMIVLKRSSETELTELNYDKNVFYRFLQEYWRHINWKISYTHVCISRRKAVMFTGFKSKPIEMITTMSRTQKEPLTCYVTKKSPCLRTVRIRMTSSSLPVQFISYGFAHVNLRWKASTIIAAFIKWTSTGDQNWLLSSSHCYFPTRSWNILYSKFHLNWVSHK